MPVEHGERDENTELRLPTRLCNVCLGTKRYQTLGFVMADCKQCNQSGRIAYILDSIEQPEQQPKALENSVETKTCAELKPTAQPKAKTWSRRKGAKANKGA